MPSSSNQTQSLRIFIVEDHADSLKYLAMYLRQCGHTVAHAHGVTETVAALGAEKPDVLLTDISLPDGTGWDLMGKLRKARRLPKYAIAMSGFGMNADRAKSIAAGFRCHLLKPLKPEQLDLALADAARELEGRAK
jgi:two-component system, chemotaxis family, CheB/CheR fusion protein